MASSAVDVKIKIDTDELSGRLDEIINKLHVIREECERLGIKLGVEMPEVKPPPEGERWLDKDGRICNHSIYDADGNEIARAKGI